MNRKLWLAACLGLSVTTAAVYAQASAGAGPQQPSNSTTKEVSEIDRAFVGQAGSANLAEIQLGQMAIAQGSSAAVKDFGQRMVTDHTAANDQLNNLLQTRNVAPASQPTLAQQKDATALQGLNGDQFDRRYATQAVKDHNMAIRLFTQEAAQGADPDLRAFAAHTLPTLKEHLRMAKALPNGM